MNDNHAKHLCMREFVAMVRGELAAAGRPDVCVERGWIDTEEPGFLFVLQVPVGGEASVGLGAQDEMFDARTDAERRARAGEFAKALINLKSAEAMLVSYAGDIRRAAHAAVQAARADGLDVLLDKVGFRPVGAWQLTTKDWRDAAFHVLAAVTIRHTSSHLRPERTTIWVEEPADVAEKMKDILEEQRVRQARVAELEAMGADLVVDQITLDLLRTHGLDATEVLSGMTCRQTANFTVSHDGREVPLWLINHEGAVTASIHLQDAAWNGEHLWFLGDEGKNDHTHLVGRSLGDLVRHPVFASRPIARVDRGHVDHIVFDLTDKALFDAASGRVWGQAAVAA